MFIPLATIAALPPFWDNPYDNPDNPTLPNFWDNPYVEGTIVDTLDDQGLSVGFVAYQQYGTHLNVCLHRTLSNESYNTLCLPFSMTAAEMDSCFGSGYQLYTMTSTNYQNGLLTISFSTDAKGTIDAGKPYLILPEIVNTEMLLYDKIYSDDLQDQTIGYVTFRPVYCPTILSGEASNIYFLGSSNLLYHPIATGVMKGLRGYFIIDTPEPVIKTTIRIDNDGITTDWIMSSTDNVVPMNKFIQNGQLLMRVNGIIYNSVGKTIK